MPPDVSHVIGGYWDVYKIAFLSGGRLAGIPFPMYPNRFPWLVARAGAGSRQAVDPAPGRDCEKCGIDLERRSRGRGIVRSAKRINWQSALRTIWVSEGRDPAELSRLQVVVP